MSAKTRPSLARRVVTGTNADGHSVIVSDAETSPWVRRPTGSLIMDVWRADTLPARVDDDPTRTGQTVSLPSPSGVCVRIAVFPPDSAVDPAAAADYEKAMRDIYGEQGQASVSSVAGMHRTETVDVVVVVDGEIWVVLDEGETLLRAGDCLVQRGTRHAWQNRSDRPCTLATTVVSTVRA